MSATLLLPLTLLLAAGGCGEKQDRPSAEPVPTPAYVVSGGLPAETAPDESSRASLALSGPDADEWRFRFDDADEGVTQQWFDLTTLDASWAPVTVPAAWDLAHPDGFDRQSIGWYVHRFTPPADLGDSVRLRFEGVFREARVWLNGAELGDTDLPYLPFAFDVTDVLAPETENRLVVRVDNRLTDTSLPCDTVFNPGKHGWFPYGGILRPVWLEGGLDTWTAQVLVRTDLQGAITADVHFGHRSAGLAGATETTAYDFAFRRLEAQDGRFTFNGDDFYLRGINRHEDHATLGPLYDADQTRQDLDLIAELGANFSRPGHYPNDVRVLRAFEQRGVLLAEEIPVYQWEHSQLGDPDMTDRAARALEAMILRDFNRPAIVMWSVANEIHSWATTAPGFIQTLYDRAKAIDPDRPVMVAAVSVPVLSESDISSGLVDVVGINEYEGWYTNSIDNVTAWLTTLAALYPERTVFVSEYGAGALLGRHATEPVGDEPLDAHSYTEEFQAHFHEQHIAQFLALDVIRGFMPWVFADFRMQWTPTTGDPHPVERMNLKGLVSADREKKLAFETIRQAFADLAAQ